MQFCCALILFTCVIAGCGGGAHLRQPTGFAHPQRVTITGYSGDAMEPFVSRDGRHLFFNNLNDPAVNTNLHWATRIDDLTFHYEGEITGVNTAALEAVGSMDQGNVFYFISNRSYFHTGSTMYQATFANGAISSVAIVPGVSASSPGMVVFDVEISPDGKTLYFAEGLFNSAGGPQSAEIVIAERNGTGFVRSTNSTATMQQINTNALNYAAAISASVLEIFFTRLEGNGLPAIYVATRTSAAEPFGTPSKIQAITGFAEAPTISADAKSLYYHKKESQFVIYRVTRP